MTGSRKRLVLFVAGPYTHPDPVVNTNAACQVGTIIFEQTAWVPLVPHTSLLWHLVTPRPIEFWYELDIALLAACDAIVRLPGGSSGADAEMAYARTIGLPVVDFDTLPWQAIDVWRRSRVPA